MSLGQKIKIARQDKRLSQNDLALALNVTRATVALWETGKRTPKTDRFLKLSEILGFSEVEVGEMILSEGVA